MTTDTREQIYEKALKRVREYAHDRIFIDTHRHTLMDLVGEALIAAKAVPVGLLVDEKEFADSVAGDIQRARAILLDHTAPDVQGPLQQALDAVESALTRMRHGKTGFTPPDAPAEPRPATFGTPPKAEKLKGLDRLDEIIGKLVEEGEEDLSDRGYDDIENDVARYVSNAIRLHARELRRLRMTIAAAFVDG